MTRMIMPRMIILTIRMIILTIPNVKEIEAVQVSNHFLLCPHHPKMVFPLDCNVPTDVARWRIGGGTCGMAGGEGGQRSAGQGPWRGE